MGFKRCPGSVSIAQPKIDLVKCPSCGVEVEVWTDEASGKCHKCGRAVTRLMAPSCLDWCQHAAECLGDDKYKEYKAMKSSMRKEALMRAVEARLADDHKRIGIVRKALDRAEALLSSHKDADPNVVLAAVALHNLESDPDLPVTMEVLEELGYQEAFATRVRELLTARRSGIELTSADSAVFTEVVQGTD